MGLILYILVQIHTILFKGTDSVSNEKKIIKIEAPFIDEISWLAIVKECWTTENNAQ